MNHDRKKIAALVEDARNLVDATADSADTNVHEVRNRLQSLLNSGMHLYDDLRDKTTSSIKATDCFVHDNPYKTLGIGLLLGALLVRLIRNRD